ncbi:MAG: DUF4143 domain-containing protein, partial [bacterium]
SFTEMREAFGWTLERYLSYGGYPGGAALVKDPGRWSQYIRDALIEPSFGRDLLLGARIEKPALMRRLFQLCCEHSGEILSYQKMLGQLQDVGNTVTLAHYLDLLGAAGLVTGLQKHAGRRVRQRASSPKLQVLNTALQTASHPGGPDAMRHDPAAGGRVVESAVGAHLLNAARGTTLEVGYWRQGDLEVDFVLRRGVSVTGIEVKSGRGGAVSGLEAFRRAFPVTRLLLVGAGGIPLGDFLSTPPAKWVGE